MLCVKLPYLFIECVFFFYEIHASSHWMVTESGLIQPRLDSPFEMVRPHDLLAFLNQEKLWDNISYLYNDLTIRQKKIDKLWSKVRKCTDAGKQIVNNEDCLKAGNVNSIDWNTAFLEDGSNKIHLNEFLLHNPYYGANNDVPDCKRLSSLPFSMCAFEHLEGMRQRENLTANPEFVLPELISPIMTIDQYGHWLSDVLNRNSSSWLHYHMASLFWRVRGNVPKAIECSRRALHHVPRIYKDVALGSLGIVLHRSGKTYDAIVILNSALEHDPTNYVSHFSIANAYSVIGEFNTSLEFYEQTLKLNPKMELALKHKYAVLCHAKLAQKIKEIRETLNKLRGELSEYKDKQADWPKMQTDFLMTIKHEEEFDYRNKEKNTERMSSITGFDMNKFNNQIEKNSLIKYFIDGPMFSDEKFAKQGMEAMDTIYSLERLIGHINKNGRGPIEAPAVQTEKPIEMNNFIDKASSPPPIPENPFPNEAKPAPVNNQQATKTPRESLSEYETGIFMYSSITINRNVEDFDKEVDWPSDEVCKNLQKMPKSLDAVVPVFMPFENKGIRMRYLLTEKLGVPLSEEHELPWHPPVCAHDRDAAHYAHKKNRQNTPEIVETDYLRTKLMEYVSDGNVDAAKHMQDAEIGHRIYVAMKKKLAPKWMILTISSLYWRVRKNTINALHCLHNAVRWVQEDYKDLVLVSLGSVYLELGYYDEALASADAAARLNLYEVQYSLFHRRFPFEQHCQPAINFLLAQVNTAKKNHKTLVYHLKQTLRVEAAYLDGYARRALANWACLLKHLGNLKEMDMGEGDICTQMKTSACEKDSENCQMSNIHCFSSHDRDDTSKLFVLLKEQEKHQSGDNMDATFFDSFIKNSPMGIEDRLGHHANYDTLIKTIEGALKGCGVAGCHNLKPEDMSMKEQDCSHQHFQLGYWLHIVSFKQLITDSDVGLPAEIISMAPSNKRVPECRIIGDHMDDFVSEKLNRINTEGWEPVMSLMHQFAEMFDSFDYVTLGAKIAKYVELRPGSWAGALAAGWWCGAGGRGACCVRCARAAHALAPRGRQPLALRALVALLHVQSKQLEAKNVAYLSFYLSPKSKMEAFLVAISHSYLAEYEQAVWMYRYALAYDDKFIPAKACLHATMCLLFFGDKGKAKN